MRYALSLIAQKLSVSLPGPSLSTSAAIARFSMCQPVAAPDDGPAMGRPRKAALDSRRAWAVCPRTSQMR